MRNLRIEFDEQPKADIQQEILRRLVQFNEETTGPASLESLAVVLRNPDDGNVVGGLWAESAYKWMFLRLLFVPAEFRGLGIGSALMMRMERYARKHGFIGIRLETHSFQAPRFYERFGYRLVGTFSDCPRGHADHIYVKYLEAVAPADSR